MEKTEIKAALIEACRKKILETIANLEAVMADAQQQANDYGPPKDRYDAFRTQLMRRRDMMAEQMSKEMNELKAIDRLDPRKILDTIGFGAVVMTDDQNYFLSISMGNMELDGISYFMISPMVPMGQALSGKKKNETTDFRGKKIKVLEVF
jgi:transcription elongation GreA/GreB family factor